MEIITTAIIKGGTAKTATVLALSQAAVKKGKRVLVIDLDPQANLTVALGVTPTNKTGAVNLFRGTPASDCVMDTNQNISIIAAHRDLSTIKTSQGSANRLREALEPIKKDFDFCFIDTPPTLGELVYNALNAANGLLIPLETDTNSLQGLYQITEIAQQIKNSNPKLQILGVVLTRYDARPKLNRYLCDVITHKGEEIGAKVLIAIHSGVAVREATSMQQSLFEYAPNSKPATDYMQLYKIITKLCKTKQND